MPVRRGRPRRRRRRGRDLRRPPRRRRDLPAFHATNIANAPATNLVQIGIGGWQAPRPGVAVGRERGTMVITVGDLERVGVEKIAETALEIAWAGADAVYLSFDIDVIDAGFVLGTGWPEPGGLLPREALNLIRLVSEPGLAGIEVVECSPPYDWAEQTALISSRVGGLFDIDQQFGALIPGLAEGRRVIAADFQGHGRTNDIARSLRTADLASDVVGLLQHLGVEKVDVFGFSVGGAVALYLAVRHPDLVRRLVVSSVSFHPDGDRAENSEAVGEMPAAGPTTTSAGSPHPLWSRSATATP